MSDLLFVTSLLVPLLLGLVVHGLCIKFGWLNRLATPIDRGRTWRGRRLLGANKTYRGIVAVGLGTAVGFGLRSYIHDDVGSGLEPGWLTRPGSAPFVFGFTVGTAAMMAELPNSFLKRQLGIGAGQAGRGVLGFLFYLIDQVDMLLGVWFVLSLAIAVNASAVAWSVLLLFGVHQLVTVAGYWLGMRSTWR
jgi:CDP-2,3-bis-(O-geranylgeranyl)-sn-glycerol synthase